MHQNSFVLKWILALSPFFSRVPSLVSGKQPVIYKENNNKYIDNHRQTTNLTYITPSHLNTHPLPTSFALCNLLKPINENITVHISRSKLIPLYLRNTFLPPFPQMNGTVGCLCLVYG